MGKKRSQKRQPSGIDDELIPLKKLKDLKSVPIPPVFLGACDRVSLRLDRRRGKVIAFSVHYDTEIDGDWHPVFRVDASPFEKPHLHTFYPDGSHRKEFLADDGKSLAAVFHEWNSHVIERYETYKERYLQHYEHRRNRS